MAITERKAGSAEPVEVTATYPQAVDLAPVPITFRAWRLGADAPEIDGAAAIATDISPAGSPGTVWLHSFDPNPATQFTAAGRYDCEWVQGFGGGEPRTVPANGYLRVVVNGRGAP